MPQGAYYKIHTWIGLRQHFLTKIPCDLLWLLIITQNIFFLKVWLLKLPIFLNVMYLVTAASMFDAATYR